MMSSVLSQGRVTPTVCAREPQHSRRAGSVALAGPPSATGRCAAPRLQRRWAGDQRVELQRVRPQSLVYASLLKYVGIRSLSSGLSFITRLA